MHELMGDATKKMPDKIKGLMLSCILSDTLEFRSPTTTELDKTVAQDLALELKLDIPTYASKMFDAKSDVSEFTDQELIRMDSKKFELSDKKLRISVLETTSPKAILGRKENLLDAMAKVVIEDDIDEVLLFIVDILEQESTLLVQNQFVHNIAKKSFGVEPSSDIDKLPGIVSRKKQIIPNITL